MIAGLRRTTPESKVADLFTASLQLLQEMEYLARLEHAALHQIAALDWFRGQNVQVQTAAPW